MLAISVSRLCANSPRHSARVRGRGAPAAVGISDMVHPLGGRRLPDRRERMPRERSGKPAGGSARRPACLYHSAPGPPPLPRPNARRIAHVRVDALIPAGAGECPTCPCPGYWGIRAAGSRQRVPLASGEQILNIRRLQVALYILPAGDPGGVAFVVLAECHGGRVP